MLWVFWFAPPESGWTLPAVDAFFGEPGEPTQNPELRTLEQQLNRTKAQLTPMKTDPWHRHTNRTKVGSAVMQHLRRRYKPEMCTRAWCKLYEMLSAFPALLPQTARQSGGLCRWCGRPYMRGEEEGEGEKSLPAVSHPER